MNKSKTPLLGAVKPRLHSKPLNTKSRAPEVIELAEAIGSPALEWQKWVLTDMLSVREDDSFIRTSNLLLAARQNGKSFIGRIRAIAGLVLFGEKNQLIMSSDRGMALTNFREIAYLFESSDYLRPMVKQIRFANGTESIEILPKYGGGRLDVVASTRSASRGRSASFLWLDELREVSPEAYAAALPVTRAQKNAQSYFSSNSGDAFSEVLNNLREKCLSNPPESIGFYEYSAPEFAKVTDRKGWAMANPSLGTLITEDAIEESLAVNTIEDFRTESLCQWISSMASPWPFQSVEDTSDSSLQLSPGPLTIFGFDVSPSKRDASLVMGQITPSGKIGVAVLETFQSPVAVDDTVVAAAIKKWSDIYFPRVIAFDKYTSQSIATKLERSGCAVKDVSGQAFYQACGELHDALANKKIIHGGQQVFIDHFNNCAAKQNDSAWRIVRRRSAGPVDIAIGVAMVVHLLTDPPEVAQIYV
jgi:phage terminase large subunit-like protein